MKLDSPEAIAKIKARLVSSRKVQAILARESDKACAGIGPPAKAGKRTRFKDKDRVLHGLPYEPPKRKAQGNRGPKATKREDKALRKITKLLKPADGKVRRVKRSKEVKRALLTKLKTIL